MMKSRRLISSIGFLRIKLSKLGCSQPLCARLKGYHPRVRPVDCCTDCCITEISAPSADGFMAEMT
jgi:hypothetical protein